MREEVTSKQQEAERLMAQARLLQAQAEQLGTEARAVHLAGSSALACALELQAASEKAACARELEAPAAFKQALKGERLRRKEAERPKETESITE